MTIVRLCQIAHDTAVEKGWHDQPRSIGDLIALMHSELSEALETYRDGMTQPELRNGKPEGFTVELADCVIRIADAVTHLYGPRALDEALEAKLKYNRTRTYRHGGKQL